MGGSGGNHSQKQGGNGVGNKVASSEMKMPNYDKSFMYGGSGGNNSNNAGGGGGSGPVGSSSQQQFSNS